jgi:SAM-dependent methyltransferase
VHIAEAKPHLLHFDALFAAKNDPWETRSRVVERLKRQAVLRALGPRKRGAGLELGCANGVSTREFSKYFNRLWGIEGSPHAAAFARQETKLLRNVSILERQLPCEMPRRLDAVIASEILYYLPPRELIETLRQIHRALRPGSVLISVNHFKRFSDSERSLAEITRLTEKVFGVPRVQIFGPCWRLDRYQRSSR